MRRLAWFLLLILSLPSLALASRDSTRSDTSVVHRQKVEVKRSTSITVPEDSVINAPFNAPYQSTATDTAHIKRFAKISRAKIDSLATDSLTVGLAKHARTVLSASDSLYQAWPFTVAIDSAGNGHRTSIGTISTSNTSFIIRQGTYAGANILGSNNQLIFVGRTTLTDSMIVSGTGNQVIFGPATTLSGTRISGDNNFIDVGSGLTAGGLGIVAGADNNTIQGRGWGSKFSTAGASAILATIEGFKTVLRDVAFYATGGSSYALYLAGCDSTIVDHVYVYGVNAGITNGANHLHIKNSTVNGPVALDASKVGISFLGNTIVGVATSANALTIAGDLGTYSQNTISGKIIVNAGADSNIITGNNGRSVLTNGGTGNITTGGIP